VNKFFLDDARIFAKLGIEKKCKNRIDTLNVCPNSGRTQDGNCEEFERYIGLSPPEILL